MSKKREPTYIPCVKFPDWLACTDSEDDSDYTNMAVIEMNGNVSFWYYRDGSPQGLDECLNQTGYGVNKMEDLYGRHMLAIKCTNAVGDMLERALAHRAMEVCSLDSLSLQSAWKDVQNVASFVDGIQYWTDPDYPKEVHPKEEGEDE